MTILGIDILKKTYHGHNCNHCLNKSICHLNYSTSTCYVYQMGVPYKYHQTSLHTHDKDTNTKYYHFWWSWLFVLHNGRFPHPGTVSSWPNLLKLELLLTTPPKLFSVLIKYTPHISILLILVCITVLTESLGSTFLQYLFPTMLFNLMGVIEYILYEVWNYTSDSQ